MLFYEPDDLQPPVLQAVVVRWGQDILERFAPNERRRDDAFVLLRDLPHPDQVVQEGGGLHYDPFDLVIFALGGGICLAYLELIRTIAFERDEFFAMTQIQQGPDPVPQFPDDPAGHLVRDDFDFLDNLEEQQADVLNEIIPVDAGTPPSAIGVNARQRRGKKDNEEVGNVAKPVVFPVTGDEFKKNNVLPVQILRLVMEEGNQGSVVGIGEKVRTFLPQTFISSFESLRGKLFPAARKR